MNDDRSHLTNPNHRLGDLRLPRLPGGDLQSLRPGRLSLMLLLIHGSRCAPCAEYLRSLGAAAPELAAWDAHLALVVPAAAEHAAELAGGPLPTFVDPEQRLQGTLALAPPALLVIDQWGEIQETHRGGDTHDLPHPARLVAAARYLATRCPECEGESL